jgi:acetylornithine deacetylase/succinyl-diaminopimelate desuccinylase-like protein
VGEEESGGNGILALVRGGDSDDGALVMEPTDLEVEPALRSSVRLRVSMRGEPAHVGARAADAARLRGRERMRVP